MKILLTLVPVVVGIPAVLDLTVRKGKFCKICVVTILFLKVVLVLHDNEIIAANFRQSNRCRIPGVNFLQ